jgi:SAM-dependent methyltransferase
MNTEDKATWEEAVSWLRSQPEHAGLVRACYYDDPILQSAQRFASSPEWSSVRRLLKPWTGGQVLDVGAGRGISSYAFAADGWKVTALEPDPSEIVGSGCIDRLFAAAKLPVTIHRAFGERLPLAESSCDVVYARAVMHHAVDLDEFCREISRVLRRGGAFLGTREHVLRNDGDLPKFLESHPLHWRYGGEKAYVLDGYLRPLGHAGLQVVKVIGPLDDPVNYFPLTPRMLRTEIATQFVGRSIARYLGLLPISPLLKQLGPQASSRVSTPGALHSFLAIKT